MGEWMKSVDAAGVVWTVKMKAMHGRRETTSLSGEGVNVFICETVRRKRERGRNEVTGGRKER